MARGHGRGPEKSSLTGQSSAELTFREGGVAELRATFDLAQTAVGDTARRMGLQGVEAPSPDEIERE